MLITIEINQELSSLQMIIAKHALPQGIRLTQLSQADLAYRRTQLEAAARKAVMLKAIIDYVVPSLLSDIQQIHHDLHDALQVIVLAQAVRIS